MSNYQLFHNDLPTQVLKSFKGDISIDTETLGLNIKRDRLCLVQMRNESNIFCTKVASKLTRTYSSKHGLKDLVKEILNIELDKNEQTSDWGKKKLSKQQIQYAINDIVYLAELKKNMEDKLLDLKRFKTFNSIMKFMDTRVELDLMGWENSDIFAHK